MWLAALAVVAATLWAYWPITGHGAVSFDDPRYVTSNEHVRSGLSREGLVWALTSRHAYNWHPLTWVSHMLDVELFGLDIGRHHMVSLLLHTASAAFLLLLLFRLTLAWWPSIAVAALFALHPAHVESVAWLSERKDTLSALLLLITIASYARYASRPSKSRYGLCLGCFAAGLMAKPMLVTIPFLLLLLDLWPLGRVGWRRSRSDVSKTVGGRSLFDLPSRGQRAPLSRALLSLTVEKLPFLLLTVGSAALTLWAQRPILKDLDAYPLDERAANAAVSYVRYLGKFLWPDDLAIFYPHPRDGLDLVVVGGSLLLLLALTALALWQLRARPFLAVGWLWFLGTLVPVIGLVQVGLQAMADRYTYIPTIGLSIALVWGLADAVERRPRLSRAAAASAFLAIVALVPLTRRQVRTWESDESLFARAATVPGGSFWGSFNLGLTHLRAGDTDAAKRAFLAALEADPEDVETLRNLGHLLEQEGRLEEALDHFERAAQLRPDDAFALRDLGRILLQLGRPAEARAPLAAARRLEPQDPELGFLLGSTHVLLREWSQARAVLEPAATSRPDHAPTQNAMGIALSQLGRLAEGVTYFRRAVELEPDYLEARRNLEAAEAALR